MNDWKQYKFSDFIEINPTVSLTAKEEYSFVEMKDLQDGTKYCFPTAQRKLSGGARFTEGDTLFARITPCLENGKICKVKGLKDGKGFGSTEFLVFREKKDVSDNDFVFYLSRWNEVRDFAERRFEGTSGRQRVPKDSFDNLFLNLPPLQEQILIASILSSLDDKINLLQRQNKTLEQLAETLFRQWFVEEADESWEIYKLSDLCALITDGKHGDCKDQENSGYYFISVKDIAEGKINYEQARQITKEDFEETDKRTRFNEGDTLITNSGTIGRMALATNVAQTRRTTFQKSVAILKPKPSFIEPFFLFSLLKSEIKNLIELAGGTTQSNLLLGDLREFEIKYPGYPLVKEFETEVSSLFNKIFANDKQIKQLTQLRNALLPKLMSGEVRVKTSNNE